MKENQIIHQPSPKAIVEHYASHVIDLNTIVVIAHFIEKSEGFEARCGFSTMTINLTTPLSVLDEYYLSAPGNEAFQPAEMGDFYSECDEQTHREIIKAQGEDPDETFARWASIDNTEHEGYFGTWIEREKRMPEPGQNVIVRTSNNVVMPATYTGKEWLFDRLRAVGCAITHWTALPQTPIPF